MLTQEATGAAGPDDTKPGPYCLPAEYVTNTTAATRDDVSGGEYWARRVAAGAVYQFPVYRLALRLARERQARSIMDVGCGLGQKLEYMHMRLPQVRITGLDQGSAIEYCKRQYAFGEWITADLDAPVPADTPLGSDIVICADVIEHVMNPDRLLDHLRSYARNGALIVLSTPARERLRGPNCLSSPNPNHVREWSAAELRQYLEKRGFQVLRQAFAYPVRIGFNRPLIAELLSSVARRRTLRYNQICVLSP